MDLVHAPKPPAAIVDACFIIGLCTKEPNKYVAAQRKLDEYVANGWELFAPGIAIGEVLSVLCKKLRDDILDAANYAGAMQAFIHLMQGIQPPPKGDASLILRAEQIRSLGGIYGCGRAFDSLYLALAEQMNADRKSELVTFDEGMKAQGRTNLPTVTVELLPVLPP